MAFTPFHFASFSDLHLGHRRNDPFQMIKALDASILHSGLLERIRLLVFAGDVFDRLLELNYFGIHEIDMWISRVMRACAKHGVVFRVLEGTKSHDRSQSLRFRTMFEVLGSLCDFRYVTDIEVEHIEALDIDVLYVPDDMPGGTIHTKEIVQTLLASRGLEQVDLCIMHGFFKYQIPHPVKETTYHDIDYYQSITRYWITIGHVHTHSRSGKVLAQGSHDRLAHNEEEPKGFIEASVGNPQGDRFWFIENKLAHIYRTVRCYNTEVGEAFEIIEQAVHDLPNFSRVRIEAESDHPIFTHMVELQKKHPALTFSTNPKSDEDIKAGKPDSSESEPVKWHAVQIHRDNIVEMMRLRFAAKSTDPAITARAMKHLSELR